jgi:hypothetical protein
MLWRDRWECATDCGRTATAAGSIAGPRGLWPWRNRSYTSRISNPGTPEAQTFPLHSVQQVCVSVFNTVTKCNSDLNTWWLVPTACGKEGNLLLWLCSLYRSVKSQVKSLLLIFITMCTVGFGLLEAVNMTATSMSWRHQLPVFGTRICWLHLPCTVVLFVVTPCGLVSWCPYPRLYHVTAQKLTI